MNNSNNMNSLCERAVMNNTKDSKGLQAESLKNLFDSGQQILFQNTVKDKNPITLEYPFKEAYLAYPLFVLNPMKPGSKERNQENILQIQGLTLEMDRVPREFQMSFYEFVLDKATVATWSGNKSIHFHHRFTMPLQKEEHQEIVRYMKMACLFADYAVLTDLTRLCRVPGGVRKEKKTVQEIQYIGERIDPKEFLGKLKNFCDKYGLKDVPQKAHTLLSKPKGSSAQDLPAIVKDLKNCGYDLGSDFGKLIAQGILEVTKSSQEELDRVCQSIEAKASQKNRDNFHQKLTDFNLSVNKKLEGVSILEQILGEKAEGVLEKEGKTILCCPCHDDKNPSAWIETHNGIEFIHCSTDGCELNKKALNALQLKRKLEKKTFREAYEELFGELPSNFIEPPDGDQYGTFIVNEDGIFSPTKDGIWEIIYHEPIYFKNRIDIADAPDEPKKFTLQIGGEEKMVEAGSLSKKNTDKLCNIGISLFGGKTQKMFDYFQEAIKDVPEKKRYKILGWKQDNTFIVPGLVDSGLILNPGHYGVSPGDLRKSIEVVKHLIQVTQDKTFLALFLFALLAPAAEKLGLNQYRFVLFCQGQTGNFKTTLSKYALAVYGREMFNDIVRFSEGATVNGLLSKCSLVGDLVMLLDNYKPNLRGGENLLIYIISALVEGKDKIRCNSDGSIKDTPTIKAWPIITGEAGIESDTSAIARCLEVEFNKGDDALIHLELAEKDKDELCHIGYSWIEWLKRPDTQEEATKLKASLWPKISKDWEAKCQKAEVVNSSRVACNFAALELVFHLAIKHPDLSFLKEYENDLHVLLVNSLHSMGRTTSEAREGYRFLSLLRQLLEARKVYLADGSGRMDGDKIGWQKDGIVYLYPDLAIAQVRKVHSDFMITRNALSRQLSEIGAVTKEVNNVKKIGGKSMRVFAVNEKFLFGDDEKESPQDSQPSQGNQDGNPCPQGLEPGQEVKAQPIPAQEPVQGAEEEILKKLE